MQRYIVALALLLLANCTSPSPTAVEVKDRVALETGAKAGQALAACELAVLDLRQCLAARDAWLDGAAEPGCLVDAVPKQHEAYLSNAVASLPPGQVKETGEELIDGVMLLQMSLRMDQRGKRSPDEQANLMETAEKICPYLK